MYEYVNQQQQFQNRMNAYVDQQQQQRAQDRAWFTVQFDRLFSFHQQPPPPPPDGVDDIFFILDVVSCSVFPVLYSVVVVHKNALKSAQDQDDSSIVLDDIPIHKSFCMSFGGVFSLIHTCFWAEGKRGRAWESEKGACEGDLVRCSQRLLLARILFVFSGRHPCSLKALEVSTSARRRGSLPTSGGSKRSVGSLPASGGSKRSDCSLSASGGSERSLGSLPHREILSSRQRIASSGFSVISRVRSRGEDISSVGRRFEAFERSPAQQSVSSRSQNPPFPLGFLSFHASKAGPSSSPCSHSLRPNPSRAVPSASSSLANPSPTELPEASAFVSSSQKTNPTPLPLALVFSVVVLISFFSTCEMFYKDQNEADCPTSVLKQRGSKVKGTNVLFYTLLVGKFSILSETINPTHPRHSDDVTSIFLSRESRYPPWLIVYMIASALPLDC
ncbi:hypothetical protein M5K25_007670 [Dendrobium thyrsiflorum]|uniref:Transmembrane protein n=1 Tax=Dendrobium thyrsiflorum TaxID=117978 RepID=A0ABD0VEZ0_DENTH